MRHAAGKHENQPNVLFQNCLHDKLEPRKCIRIGFYLVAICDIFPYSVLNSNFYIGMSKIDGVCESCHSPLCMKLEESWSLYRDFSIHLLLTMAFLYNHGWRHFAQHSKPDCLGTSLM